MKHVSAQASHYNETAKEYDAIYDKFPEIDNKLISSILKKQKANDVLDLSCGTGSQALYLAKEGFYVEGYDINRKMISIAKKKAARNNIDIKLCLGDMRCTNAGKFDSAITIFNSIGHLTKVDFRKTLRNIKQNLNKSGIYVFDIFNATYLLEPENLAELTIDEVVKSKDKCVRKIQYSTMHTGGVLASYTIQIVKDKITGKERHTRSAQTLQTYSAVELEQMLQTAGFRLKNKYEIDGSRFSDKKTKHMLLVAQVI